MESSEASTSRRHPARTVIGYSIPKPRGPLILCGRYQITVPFRRLVELYGFARIPASFSIELPAFNVVPTQSVPVIFQGEKELEVQSMRWGFPPLWVVRKGKDPWRGRPLINVRSETALQKPTWSEALRRRRCLIPCTGFYEWRVKDKKRYPVWFKPCRTDVLSMAGVWSTFEREGTEVNCVSILTTEANARVSPIHHRMPVFVPLGRREEWVSERTDEQIRSFFRAAPDGILSLHPVSTSLGQRTAQGPEVLKPDWTLDPEIG